MHRVRLRASLMHGMDAINRVPTDLSTLIAYVACHSERSEESACARSIHVGSLGFFAALRMTGRRTQRNLIEDYNLSERCKVI